MSKVDTSRRQKYSRFKQLASACTHYVIRRTTSKYYYFRLVCRPMPMGLWTLRKMQLCIHSVPLWPCPRASKKTPKISYNCNCRWNVDNYSFTTNHLRFLCFHFQVAFGCFLQSNEAAQKKRTFVQNICADFVANEEYIFRTSACCIQNCDISSGECKVRCPEDTFVQFTHIKILILRSHAIYLLLYKWHIAMKYEAIFNGA